MAMCELSKVFDELIANLQLVVEQIKGDEAAKPERQGFSGEEYWTRAGQVVKALSHEATKMCLAFSQPPPPSAKECRPLIEGIEKASLTCVSLFASLPLSEGLTLRKSIQNAIVRILSCLKSLVSKIQRDGFASSISQMQSTGSVWEECDKFPLLPKNNKSALGHLIKVEYGLIKDALEEIEEAVKADGQEEDGGGGEFDDFEEEDDEDEKWTDDDKKLLSPAIGLVKTSKACLKKLQTAVEKNGQCSSAEDIIQLDGVGERLREVSPQVDDYVTVLYPPLNHNAVRENAEKLESQLNDLLQHAKHCHVTTEDDAKWVEFLLKAVKHNTDNIRQFSQSGS